MTLQVPIPVSFTPKMETTKAVILTDICIDGQLIVAEAVVPKMYFNATDTNNGFIESWVLTQRIEEERKKNVDDAKAEILAMIAS